MGMFGGRNNCIHDNQIHLCPFCGGSDEDYDYHNRVLPEYEQNKRAIMPIKGGQSMAENNSVAAKIIGGAEKFLSLDEVRTVGDVKRKMGATSYKATVNGEPADDNHVLSGGEFVSLTEAVKGGC
jgi:hypothetical protein